MATPVEHDLPDHLLGDTFGYSFDFSEYPTGYLEGVEAVLEFRACDSASAPTVLALSLGSGLTLDGTKILVDEFTPELAAKTYYYRLRLTWPAISRVHTVARGSWKLVP